jgi:hypothetical protein
MSVVAKFQCHDVLKSNPAIYGAAVQCADKVRLGPVWEGSNEKQALSENAIFGKATPSGEIWMTICNQPASDFFQPGKKYYVTFTEAPD